MVEAINVSFCSYSHASQHYCSKEGADLLKNPCEAQLGYVKLIRRRGGGFSFSKNTTQCYESTSSSSPQNIRQSRTSEKNHRSFISLTCDDQSPEPPQIENDESDEDFIVKKRIRRRSKSSPSLSPSTIPPIINNKLKSFFKEDEEEEDNIYDIALRSISSPPLPRNYPNIGRLYNYFTDNKNDELPLGRLLDEHDKK
eukprot:GHVL01010617.1.p1 GENE.GHVL01010617.1~~GHVL01010617.1.p1  ORF type:complete len:198 (+),score=50.89 GHVL01010617.1:133-726(+)